jgi:hypothetical protein
MKPILPLALLAFMLSSVSLAQSALELSRELEPVAGAGPLSGTHLVNEQTKEHSITFAVMVRNVSEAAINPSFKLQLTDGDACNYNLALGPLKEPIPPGSQRALELSFGPLTPTASAAAKADACKAVSSGALKGNLSYALRPESGSVLPVTVAAQPDLGFEKRWGLSAAPIMTLGLWLPVVIAVLVMLIFCVWLAMLKRPVANAGGNPSLTVGVGSWVLGEVAWNPAASVVTTLSAITTLVNLVNVVPKLHESSPLAYLTPLQHTFFGVTFTGLSVLGTGVLAALSVRARSLDPNDDESKNPKGAAQAWALALRNALSVAGVVGQLLLVLVVILEAFRARVLPFDSTLALLGIMMFLMGLLVFYGVRHAVFEVFEFARAGTFAAGVFEYPAIPPLETHTLNAGSTLKVKGKDITLEVGSRVMVIEAGLIKRRSFQREESFRHNL